jgi:hypothetical protein
MKAKYNKHGVIVSKPDKVLEAKNRKGYLTLSFYNDSGAWRFGYDGWVSPTGKVESAGSHHFSGMANKNRDESYNSFAAAKEAAFNFCKRQERGHDENKKVIIKLLNEMNNGLYRQPNLWEEEKNDNTHQTMLHVPE